MASAGSYLRFFVGLLLSLEVIRQALFGSSLSGFAIGLSVLFIILTLVFVLEKTILR